MKKRSKIYKIKKNKNYSLYLVAAIALIAIISLVIISKYNCFRSIDSYKEGFYVSEGEERNIVGEATTRSTRCSDSDSGKNYLKKGTVTWIADGQYNERSDECDLAGEGVNELYCEENKLAIHHYICPSGTCKNSICIEAYCTDSDSGKNYYNKGTVSWGPIEGEYKEGSDKCATDSSLNEVYCEENKLAIHHYRCPSGACKNGVCVR